MLRLKEVPEYVDRKLGRTVSYMTVCNWVNKGLKGEKLKTVPGRSHPKLVLPNMRLTTEAWVDEFLNRVGA
jgi:transposase